MQEPYSLSASEAAAEIDGRQVDQVIAGADDALAEHPTVAGHVHPEAADAAPDGGHH